MSIASEITSMGENLKKDYQSIANLGADLTNVDKNIENIAELLDGVYDVLPKTSFQEGTEVTIENGLKGKIDFDDGKVGFGQASQESTQGYNLFNPTEKFNNLNGVSSTIDNQIMTWNGTASANGAGKVANANIPSGTCTISLVSVSGSHTSNKRIWVDLYNGSTKIANTSFTQGGNVQLNLNNSINSINLGFDSGDVFNNYAFKLQIESGSTAHDWEQYTGGYASPSPNWEQEVKCVAGRNKFKGTLYNGIINNSGDYVSNSTRITNSNNGSNSQVYLEKGTYTLSIKDLDYCSVLTKNASGTIVDNYAGTWNTLPFTFNVTSEAYVYISARKSSNIDISPSDYNIMLEEGSTAHPYLPYNTIQETIRGLNFFEAKMATDTSAGVTVTNNNDGTFTLNGTATGNTTFRIDQLSRNSQDNLKSYENGTYTLSMGNSKSGLGMSMMQIDTYRTFMYVGSGSSLVSRTLTNATNMFIYLDITSGTQFSNFVVKPMLVKGTYTAETLPNFEPYVTPRTYQFSLGNNKFYKIGDYADELLYDVVNDKVYKLARIGEVTFSNVATIYQESIFGVNKKYFFQTISTAKNLGNPAYNFYCEILSKSNGVANDYSGFFNGNNIVVLLNDNDTSSTATEKYSGKSLLFVLNTPTLTELTDTTLHQQVKNWYYSQSYNGTTIIESNGDLPMIIKVRALKGE